mgnify:CR=1 FL=1|tara:strand:- start:48 stop:314 length:267 start_codon:yes stop_codon:yes gene_type:complete
MALEKSIVEDKIEIVDRGKYKTIQVRTATIVTDDGTELSRTFHRHVVNPNDDVSKESDEVKKLAEIYFTDDAKAEHQKVLDAKAGGPL